ncbi:MAG TPA: anti-sigma factor [Pseudonocardiaceae bacterium]|nr:anti-sigma factor [Pseudonocardiaceae bacterium]
MNDQQQRPVVGCPHRDLAVGWALHALEPAEESLLAIHMPECPTCIKIAAETEEIGATLGLSVPEAIPSAELEQRILSVTGASRIAPVVPIATSMGVGRIAKASRQRVRELVAAAAVILVAAAVVLGVRVVQLNGELNQAQRQVAGMSEAIQSAADPESIRVPLVTKNGSAVGMVLANREQVAVVSTRLPSNSEDHTYVLWGLDGGAPVALTAFDVAREAPGPHSVPGAGAPGKFTGYAVSLEPGRRAPATPTDIVASGQVTR